MPLTTDRLHEILGELDREYTCLAERHYRCAPRNGIPVGGGDWMDLFFRMEAVRGVMTSLRGGKSLREAVADGKTASEVAVKIWNGRREWQVRRWEHCCHDYLDGLIRKLRRE